MTRASDKWLDPEVLARAARLELRARMVVEGFVSGLHRSPYHGFSVEFAAHREYVPGDDTRHIDWRLFGRGDRLHIKQYEEETSLRAHVVLDCSGSMLYPEHPPPGRLDKQDYARTLAAAVLWLLIHQGDACGLVLFDESIRQHVPPTGRRDQLVPMLERIAAQPSGGKTDMARLFAELPDRIPRRGLLVLISDLLADPATVTAGLQQLRHAGHDVLVLHVMDADELTFPFAERALFEGIETPDRRLPADPQALRRSYLQAVERFIAGLRSACIDHRIDYTLLSTADPPASGLSACLAARMRRAGGR